MAIEIFPGVIVDPQIVHGRPVVAGTRVPVETVVGALAGGSSFEEVIADYHLTDQQIRAALGYATQMLNATNGRTEPLVPPDTYPLTGLFVQEGQTPPDDATVTQWVDEDKMEKYGG